MASPDNGPAPGADEGNDGSQAPQDNAQGGAQPGSQDATQAFLGVNNALTSMFQALSQDPSVPKPAIQALMAAKQAYTQFIQIFLGKQGADQQGAATMGQQNPDVAGNSGAVPADQPMGKNIKAVPA